MQFGVCPSEHHQQLREMMRVTPQRGPPLARRFQILNRKFHSSNIELAGRCNKSIASTGGTREALTKEDLELFEIPLPPLPEQQRIGGLLAAYDDLIRTNTERQQVLEALARQLYQEWFVRLRFPGHAHTPLVNGLPQGWKLRSIWDRATIMSGGTPATQNENYWNGDIPFFTPKDVGDCFYAQSTEQYMTADGLRNCNSSLFPEQTILMTARGTVGKMVLSAVPMAMNQSCFALKERQPGKSNFWLFLALLAFAENLKQVANGAVFDTIILNTFRTSRIVVPEQAVIDKFSDLVTPLFQQSAVLQERNIHLRQTRDALLPRLLSGQLPLPA